MVGFQQKLLIGLAAMLAQFVLSAGAYADWTEQIGVGIPAPVEKPKVRAKQSSPVPQTGEAPSLASRLRACPALISGAVTAKYLPAVQTETLCGAEAPLEVVAVLDVALKPAAQLNCGMTTALIDWVRFASAVGNNQGLGRLTTINTSASYVCRRRNNKPNGKFSEHATMNALDIAGFTFESGRQVTVLDGWPKAEENQGRFLRDVHGHACKVFTTTLGPDSDEHHRNHFHLDLGCHGKTCTYKLCQ